jgi:hypothetical protein
MIVNRGVFMSCIASRRECLHRRIAIVASVAPAIMATIILRMIHLSVVLLFAV